MNTPTDLLLGLGRPKVAVLWTVFFVYGFTYVSRNIVLAIYEIFNRTDERYTYVYDTLPSEYHGVANQRQIACLFNRLFSPWKHQSSASLALSPGDSPQRTNNAERVSFYNLPSSCPVASNVARSLTGKGFKDTKDVETFIRRKNLDNTPSIIHFDEIKSNCMPLHATRQELVYIAISTCICVL